jgi:hypothetical protein
MTQQSHPTVEFERKTQQRDEKRFKEEERSKD